MDFDKRVIDLHCNLDFEIAESTGDAGEAAVGGNDDDHAVAVGEICDALPSADGETRVPNGAKSFWKKLKVHCKLHLFL